MNNFLYALKKFVSNKNTVTILGIVICLCLLYFGYNSQIKKQTNPTSIFVAKETIQPKKLITREMLETIKVSPVMIKDGVVRNVNSIVGKYTNYNTVIPKGSMFYAEVLVDKEILPDTAFGDLEDGQIPYNFPVNMDTTYGNSMTPNSYIDIYMKAVDDSGTLMVGRLLENVKILAVKDQEGKNVFENTSETRTPDTLIFGVDDEVHILLRKASYLTSFGVVLFPVPHGGNNTSYEGATKVSSQYLKEFINANTVANDELLDNENVVESETDNNTETGE